MTDRPHSPPPAQAETPAFAPESGETARTQNHSSVHGWVQRLSSVLFIVFCFELGLFLLIYPWTMSWTQNYFSWLAASRFHSAWHEFWNNTYFRGAVSGLGAANVWIAMTEVLRLFGQRRNHRA